jgi:hypothetical protein
VTERKTGRDEPAILARTRVGEWVDHFETVRRHKNDSLIDISLSLKLNIAREWLLDGLCIRLSAPYDAIGR